MSAPEWQPDGDENGADVEAVAAMAQGANESRADAGLVGMSAHAVEVTLRPNGWQPDFRAICSSPSADCHYVCAEGCETWGPIVRNEAGAVIGHEVDGGGGTHHMEYVEECNYVGFLNNSDEWLEDMTGEPFTFVIPAEFTYAIESVTWAASA